jgi:hypothetical protein
MNALFESPPDHFGSFPRSWQAKAIGSPRSETCIG